MLLAGKLLAGSDTSEPAGAGAVSVPAALRAANPDSRAPAPEGVSVSDLPLEERQEQKQARPPVPVYRTPVPRAPVPAPAPAPAKPVWLEEAVPSGPDAPSASAPTSADTAQEGGEEKVLPVSPYATAGETAPEDPNKPKIVLEEEPETPPAEAKEKTGPYKLKVPGLKESE